jgi:hypothetical protein
VIFGETGIMLHTTGLLRQPHDAYPHNKPLDMRASIDDLFVDSFASSPKLFKYDFSVLITTKHHSIKLL